MLENRNTIVAVILSGLILIAWQYFYNIPQMERQRAAQQQSELQKKAATQPANNNSSATNTPPQAGSTTPAPAPANSPATATSTEVLDREAAIAATPRVKIETPSVVGSISLKGARIDDLSLVKFRETVDPNSPPSVLFSTSMVITISLSNVTRGFIFTTMPTVR